MNAENAENAAGMPLLESGGANVARDKSKALIDAD